MEDKQIFNNLKGLREIKPENAWKQGLKSQLFDMEDSQKTVFSRGFLHFNFNLKGLNFAPALIPIAVVSIVLVGVLLSVNLNQGPGKTAEQANYLVLLETRLDNINTAEDMQGLASMFEQASDSISDTEQTPEERANVAKVVTNINKKVEQLEKDFGEQTKDLKDSAQVLTVKASEALGQDIENVQEELVSNLIKSYELRTLSNPQLELLNQAKEYYNNEQFELAFEAILRISQ